MCSCVPAFASFCASERLIEPCRMFLVNEMAVDSDLLGRKPALSQSNSADSQRCALRLHDNMITFFAEGIKCYSEKGSRQRCNIKRKFSSSQVNMHISC